MLSLDLLTYLVSISALSYRPSPKKQTYEYIYTYIFVNWLTSLLALQTEANRSSEVPKTTQRNYFVDTRQKESNEIKQTVFAVLSELV